jgi:hypothetical protein
MLAANSSMRRQEPFGIIALGLALFMMVLPLEPDILWMLHRSGRDATAITLWSMCFLVVATPLVVSWRRLRRYPGRWRRGFETWIITVCILAWNIFGLISLL